MVRSLRKAIGNFVDKRTGKNTTYTMMDIGAGAFSVFFTQSPSFLAHQRMMQLRYGINNARTLFAIADIPTDTHIKDTLDPVTPSVFDPVFHDCLHALDRSGHLDTFRTGIGNNDLLITLDGTWYFSSETIHCGQCSIKKKDGITTYQHGMINPAIVAPGQRAAIALPPEFIIPQDGDKKQDCEHKAGKRWLTHHQKTYAPLHATILGDDLYCHQPMCELIRSQGFNFILVCKPDSHKTLYEWIEGITETNVVTKHTRGKTETWTYRFVSDVPLRDGDDAMLVNWCELTVERDRKQIFKNAFVTNHPITTATVGIIVACGRTRWKTENENNNTLKTKGYHLEHNFGHGKMHLASLLATMNVLAFLFHTMLEFMNKKYQLLRLMIGTRVCFFNDFRAMVKFVCFKSFNSMLQWMIDGLKKQHDASLIPVPV
jgi:hypothetical protein